MGEKFVIIIFDSRGFLYSQPSRYLFRNRLLYEFMKKKENENYKIFPFLSLTRSRLCIVIIKQRDSKQIPYCDFQLDLCFPLILPVFSYARRTVIQQNGFSTFFLLSLWPSLIPIGRIIIYTWENCLKENFGVYVSELIDKKVVGNYSNESGNER